LSILVLKGDNALRDLFKMILNLDEFVNVPQYPGYPGYQHLEAVVVRVVVQGSQCQVRIPYWSNVTLPLWDLNSVSFQSWNAAENKKKLRKLTTSWKIL
jgi:hypothetical protein